VKKNRKNASRAANQPPIVTCATCALAPGRVPSLLKLSSLSRDDGKRPDGLTILPLVNDRCLIWDFTCSDTLAAIHLDRAMLAPGAVANNAEQHMRSKYFSVMAGYHFVPVAMETLGSLGDAVSPGSWTPSCR
jgi:hypothetical protein